jgi:hypothetical protein
MKQTTDDHIGQPSDFEDDGYDDTPLPSTEFEVDYAGMLITLTVTHDDNNNTVTKMVFGLPDKLTKQLLAACDIKHQMVEDVSGTPQVGCYDIELCSDAWISGAKK